MKCVLSFCFFSAVESLLGSFHSNKQWALRKRVNDMTVYNRIQHMKRYLYKRQIILNSKRFIILQIHISLLVSSYTPCNNRFQIDAEYGNGPILYVGRLKSEGFSVI